MVNYIDLYGDTDSVSFNPEVTEEDGEIVIKPLVMYVSKEAYKMPRHVLDSHVLLCDYKAGVYRSSESDATPGTFPFIKSEGEEITVLRYRDDVKKPVVEEMPDKVPVDNDNNILYLLYVERVAAEGQKRFDAEKASREKAEAEAKFLSAELSKLRYNYSQTEAEIKEHHNKEITALTSAMTELERRFTKDLADIKAGYESALSASNTEIKTLNITIDSYKDKINDLITSHRVEVSRLESMYSDAREQAKKLKFTGGNWLFRWLARRMNEIA